MLAESPQEHTSPPDKANSCHPPPDTTYSSSKSTVKISTCVNSRVSKKPCRYIRANQVCPFGPRCHFSHDTQFHQLNSSPTEISQASPSSKRNHKIPPLSGGQHTASRNDTKPSHKHKNWLPRNPRKQGRAPTSNGRSVSLATAISSDEVSLNSLSLAQSKEGTPLEVELTSPVETQILSKEVSSVEQYSKQNSKPDFRDLKHHPSSQDGHRQPASNLEQRQSRSRPFTSSSRQQPQRKPEAMRDRQGPSELKLGSFLTPSLARPPVQRPRPKKASTATPSELREVELEQLEMRFPNCVLLEKGRERCVYSFSYQPADPEWDLSFKSLTFEVAFPGEYPLQPLGAQITNKTLSNESLQLINSQLELHLTTEGFMAGMLMFRPFLHWIDRNIANILRDAISQEPLEDVPSGIGIEGSDSLSDSDSTSSEDDTENIEEVSVSTLNTAPVKAGTEIRLVNLNVSPSVATVTFTSPKIVVACGRCKQQEDIRAKPESAVSVSCSRCQTVATVIYHPALVHASSATLGYLDMNNCSAVDLVLLDCLMSLVCLDCNHDNRTKTLLYGQPKDFWCHKCHSKLSVGAQQCRFIKHQPADVKITEVASMTRAKSTRSKDPALKLGQSLPDNGTCVHYKKSYRWFRFPCCGKAYPCDICHDQMEDHTMERARRMICGQCSLEQVYSTSKPCIGCGSDMASLKHTSHWEGGKGCRSKTKMNRLDKHKYTNSAQKTTSQKSKRVGKQDKS